MIPGFDVVGKVVCSGESASNFKAGDRVAALIRTGGNARYVSVPASSLVRVPLQVDSAEAAAMVSTYTAAYQAMKLISTEPGSIFSLKGKKVLIIGGMDSTGQALIQMCQKARAEIYATAPERRHSYIKTILGATPLPEQNWLPAVQGEMDVVFDGLCEDGLVSATKALKPKSGQLVCFGYSAVLKQEMGLLGAPLVAHFNKIRSFLATEKSVDIWESFQRDPELFKVKKALISLGVHHGLRTHFFLLACHLAFLRKTWHHCFNC